MPWTRSLLLPAIVAISAAAHAGVFVAVRSGPREAAKAPSLVEIAVAPPPARPAPPPPPEPAVADQARVAPRPSRTEAAPRPIVKRAAPPVAPPPSAPPPPADFTGTTLTNDSGEAWAAATGDGQAMSGPIGAPAETRAPTKTADTPGPRVAASGPPVVALADLSRPPRAPNLNDALAHHYPATARQRGVVGKAVVKARIDADGKARVLDVVSESFDGFGVACRRTLDGTRWDPPQDRSGHPVATVLTYTCRFEVGS